MIKDNGLGFIFHLDYSENIICTEKICPQDSHFDAKQISLHCAVIFSALNSDVHYSFHLNDDKHHDTAFTTEVILDLLNKFPDYEMYPVLRFKSDNCSSQYCCKFLLPFYKDLAQKLAKPVLLYYGVNGHGRGVIDACSGFGVKSVVRRTIVTHDFFYNSDDELFTFLESEMSNKANFHYKVLSPELLNATRVDYKKSQLVIGGCHKSRMISFLPSGEFQISRHVCSCERCNFGQFNKCVVNTGEESLNLDDVEEDVEDIEENGEVANSYDDRYEMVVPGTYVALLSHPNSLELFII